MKNKALRISLAGSADKAPLEVLSFIGTLLVISLAVVALYLIPVELLVISMAIGFVITALYWICRR